MSRSLIRKNQLHPDIADLVGQYGSGFFASDAQVVYISGNQTISGAKTFATGIFAPNLVYNTGDQTINGIKSFVNSSDYLVAKFEGPNGNPLEILTTDDNFNGGYGSAAYAIGVGFHGFAVKYSSSDTDWGQPILVTEGAGNVVYPTSTITFPQPLLAPNLVYNTGDQTISGVKTFANSGIFNNGIDLNNSKLINAVPDFNNFNANFSISGNQNNRILIANSASQITGTIAANNPTGFNTTVIQVGNGKILITGSVNILSYFDQYRTAGRGAAISILHTGNNGYVMYGNTSL